MVLGYHPGDYSFPKTKEQILEVCLGAILTQNTNWKNVILALSELKNQGLFSLDRLQKAETNQIALAIKSAGYYNQKARTIKNMVQFLKKKSLKHFDEEETARIRIKLLSIKGIGPETADSILLYGLKKSSFVVDTYTRRILEGIGIVDQDIAYEELKNLFEISLDNNVQLFQEYHALLVRHAKLHYSKKPYGVNDHLLNTNRI